MENSALRNTNNSETLALQSPAQVNFFHVSKEFIIQSAYLIV